MPTHPIHPGETLREALEAIGMSQVELATRMKRPVKTINEIIKGIESITPGTANQLERVLGISSKFWINLQSNFDIAEEKARMENQLTAEDEKVPLFPYSEMANLGWVKKTRIIRERTLELLSFFGVVSFSQMNQVFKGAYRKKHKKTSSQEALAAWLRLGELKAQKINVENFDKKKFRKILKEARALTKNTNKDFRDKLTTMCALCGVCVTYVPHLKRTYVNGATRWLTSTKALIQLSYRYRYKDIMWFTFFHEAAHLLLHNKSENIIDYVDQKQTEEEKQADEWASKFLIPKSAYRKFTSNFNNSESSIIDFAQELGIGPDIVVGRLQHDGIIKYNQMNHLRIQLEQSSH